MSESDSDIEQEDEDILCRYGSALTPYEADEIPSKKPLQIEDQIVKDENGKRRFHGAFTGGFSAGFWNTVGSLEGFKPSEFKSSRGEKGQLRKQAPTDFMDEEDMGEFGIAPQKIQTKEDFASTTSSKRKLQKPSDGPIPGDPVLKNLLTPVHDKAAVKILKKMGWRENQGVGSRLTGQQKKRTNQRNQKEILQKRYGCDLGPMNNETSAGESDEDPISDDEITFAPDDFDPYVASIKENSFGLGYSGLAKQISSYASQHINLFQPFQVLDRNNKKLSITGQAFGVGAMEEDDEDIYAPDDLTKYDRSLDDKKKKVKQPKAIKMLDSSLIEGFSKTRINDNQMKVFPVDIPRNFQPRNWLTRKSRFAPLDNYRAQVLEDKNNYKRMGLGRHDLKPEQRGVLLNDDVIMKPKEEEKAKDEEVTVKPPPIDREKMKNDKIIEAAKKLTELMNSKQFVSEKNEVFKPFLGNPEKQERYEKFLVLKAVDEKTIDKFLSDIQPLNFSNFDREREKKEFMQAKRMYKPLDSLIADRFVKEVEIKAEKGAKKKIENGKEVTVIVRTKLMWKPHKELCKRFNVPEPYGGNMFDEEAEKKRKKKNSTLFDYIGVPINTKANFVNPQVVPRKMVIDDRRKDAEDSQKKNFLAAVEKEKSFMNVDQHKRAAAKDFFNSEPMTSTHNIPLPPEVRKESQNVKEVEEIRRDPPRTELEKKVAESINKKPEDKKDLFKSIFCDSDDEDEMPEKVEKTKEKDVIAGPSSQLSEKQKSSFIESFINTKSAGEINVLRNMSPPRGLFKSFLQPARQPEKPIDLPVDDYYGPKLPDKPIFIKPLVIHDSSSSDSSDLDAKLLKKLKKSKKIEEQWIDKSELEERKKHKKHKEHKDKDKHKHKKSKSKKKHKS
ncbi:unnamed protein product [Diamesa hyperborea]